VYCPGFVRVATLAQVAFGSKPSHLLGLTLLLIPSAAFLWRNSDLPQFGDIHDDSIYYVSAKSLAEGHYQIESLPGQPAQTKYPPLYPLLLSVAWRLNPQFPQNLPIAAWLSWLAFPVMLALLAALYPRMGISGWQLWLLLILLAFNPYIILFGSKLLSELWFTALLAGVLLLVERAVEADAGPGWAVAAGGLSGLVYLTRSAGIVLLASAFLYLWMHRERRKAVLFAVSMIPFVAGWMLWSRLHQFHTNDPALVYYTDYFRGWYTNVSLTSLHLLLWKNLDGFLWGLGSLIIPNVTSSFFVKILAELIAVAMISGVVRMVRRGRAVHYAMFAAGSAFMLLVWHFPPNERFVLPLFPLALAGLLTEMEHFAGIARAGLRHRDVSQRIAAAIMASAVALVFVGALGLQAYVGGVYLNEEAQTQRERNVDLRGAYAWMRVNLPADAAVIAYNDPVLFLYTGRESIGRPLPPAIWYNEDHARAVELYSQIAPYAREHGAAYVYHTSVDFRRDMSEAEVGPIEDALRSNPALTPVYRRGIGTIYKVSGE
jgi:hypothetical protein